MAVGSYSYSNAAPLPLDHFAAALRFLLHRGDVEFITYDDLRWVDGHDYEKGYPLEWAAWRETVASGKLNRNRIYLLIQHDTDSGPQESIDMLNVEEEYGVVSSTMVHFRWR